METWEWVVLGVTIGAGLLLFAALARIRTRRSHLKSRFGPEYSRVVSDAGVGDAERRLAAVERERETFEIRELPAATRERLLEDWRQAEARFISDPREATRAAERVVVRALEERGYPRDDDDGEHLAALVSVDHPDVAERYRHGQAMLGTAENTENLRKAMLDFRAVLEDVVEDARTAA